MSTKHSVHDVRAIKHLVDHHFVPLTAITMCTMCSCTYIFKHQCSYYSNVNDDDDQAFLSLISPNKIIIIIIIY